MIRGQRGGLSILQILHKTNWSLQSIVFVVGFVLIGLNLAYFQFDDDGNNNKAATSTTEDFSPRIRATHPPQQDYTSTIETWSPTAAPARSEEKIFDVTTPPVDNATTRTSSSAPSPAVSTHINDQPFVPPPWARSYVEFHKAQIQKGKDKKNKSTLSDSSRWLQWYCNYNDDGQRHCGGLADRIKGMMEALILAMVDQRVILLEEWEGSPSTGQHPLTDYLQPNTINWNLAPNTTNSVTTEEFPTFVDDFGLSKSPAQRIVKSAPCNFSLPHAVGVRFTGNLLTDENILTAPGCGAKFGSDFSTVYSSLFWTLFRFSPAVHAEADRLRGPTIIPQHRNYYVAAHVRTGNFSDAATPADHLRQNSVEAWDQFASCIQAVAESIQARCGGDAPPITYLASDNADAKRYIKQKVMLDRAPVHAPDVEMMHIDLHNDTSSRHQNNIDGNQQHAGYRAVLGELKILMDSTCIITSDSGFSRMAKYLTRQRPRCAIAYDRCSNPGKVAKKTAMVPCPGTK